MASVRDAFFTEIYSQVKKGENIYIVTADLGAPSLDDFRRDFPDRYISSGIAEQDLIQISAGMTWGGCNVIAYGLNPFPVTRAFDQVRCLMAELNVPLTLCVLNAGLCSAECGYTHMPIEDMAMLRTLSNIEVYNPSDETVSRKLARETGLNRKPRIIRFDKSISGTLYDDVDFRKGFAIQGKEGSAKLGIITNGCYSKELSQICLKNCDNIKLIDLFKLPVDESSLAEELNNCNNIICVEENVRRGGIGSMVLEIISDYEINKSIRRFGLDLKSGYYDVFTDRNYIRQSQGIDIDHLLGVINGYVADGVI